MEKLFYRGWKYAGFPDPSDCIKPGCTADQKVVGAVTGHAPKASDRFAQASRHLGSNMVGGVELYETFERRDDFGGWNYRGLCERGCNTNRHPKSANRIFLVCDCWSENKRSQNEKLSLAASFCGMIADEGGIPVCPELYFTQFIDENVPFNRAWIIAAGCRMMEGCQSVLVLTVSNVVTEAMRRYISHAANVLAMEPVSFNGTPESFRPLIKQYLNREETGSDRGKY